MNQLIGKLQLYFIFFSKRNAWIVSNTISDQLLNAKLDFTKIFDDTNFDKCVIFVDDPMKVPFNEIKDGVIYMSIYNSNIKDSDFVMYKLKVRNSIDNNNNNNNNSNNNNNENENDYKKNKRNWIVISGEIKFSAEDVQTKVNFQIDVIDKINSSMEKLINFMNWREDQVFFIGIFDRNCHNKTKENQQNMPDNSMIIDKPNMVKFFGPTIHKVLIIMKLTVGERKKVQNESSLINES